MGRKLRIVWICAFSNEKTRQHYVARPGLFLRIINKKVKHIVENQDYAVWNSNGVAEMEKRDDVELYIISPIRYLAERETRFDINGIHYYYFREENSSFLRQVIFQLFLKHRTTFRRNRQHISDLIAEIQPDLVHVIGAENPYYSTSILDVPTNIPTIIQLQALLHKAQFETTLESERKYFHYKGKIEELIFNKATYIGTRVDVFIEYIKQKINPEAQFVDISLPVAEPVNESIGIKEFDFVYFSVDIQKAADWAIEAFALALEKMPTLTLDIIGGYSYEFKAKLDCRLRELGISDSVTFEGKLQTHVDVISQIRKSRYALLPLKMDVVPSTIREAMANGLPVVTTFTEGGTPKLNENEECVLISPQGDFQAMADNMIRLSKNCELSEKLRQNSFKKASESQSNSEIVDHLVDIYRRCIEI